MNATEGVKTHRFYCILKLIYVLTSTWSEGGSLDLICVDLTCFVESLVNRSVTDGSRNIDTIKKNWFESILNEKSFHL